MICLFTSIFIFLTEHEIIPSGPFVKGEFLIQTSNKPEDSKNKQMDLIRFNESISQIDSCCSYETNKQIEHAQDNVSYSKLIDNCHDYPSDPYLFIDTILTPQIIRTLVEIGPCQPGFNNNDYVFSIYISA